MSTGNKHSLAEIGNSELTILVQNSHYSSSGYHDSTSYTYTAHPCTAAEARKLIEKLTRSGTSFQVVRPISTTVEINIKFDEDCI